MRLMPMTVDHSTALCPKRFAAQLFRALIDPAACGLWILRASDIVLRIGEIAEIIDRETASSHRVTLLLGRAARRGLNASAGSSCDHPNLILN